MFARLLLIEEIKLLKNPLVWVVLLAACAIPFSMVILPYFATNAGTVVEEGVTLESITWPYAVDEALVINRMGMGGTLLAVLVGAVLAQDYGHRSLHVWLGRGVPRPILFLSKIGALIAGPLLLMAILPALLSGLCSLMVTPLLGIELSGQPALHIGYLTLSILRAVLTLGMTMALTALFAILSRSPIIAIGGSIMFETLGNSVVWNLVGQMGGFGEWTARFFPRGISTSMHSLDRVMAGPTLGMLDKYNDILFSPGVAPLAALGFILVCLGIAGLIFQRQDLFG